MDELSRLYDEMMAEKQQLEERLKEIEKEANSILVVLNIVKKRKHTEDVRQMSFIPEEKTNEYADMTFEDAALDLLSKHPARKWEPKEIASALLNGGYVTKAKRFGSNTRTMLQKFKDRGIVKAEKIKKGNLHVWIYQHKEEDEE